MGSTKNLHCFNCYKHTSRKTVMKKSSSDASVQRLLKCTRCQVAWYCSIQCQKQNFLSHKDACIRIKNHLNQIDSEAEALKSVACGLSYEKENIFETQVGNFWGLLDPRDYCRSLFALAQEYKYIAHDDDLISVWQRALDIELELLRLNYCDNMGIRFIVPFTLLEMNRENAALNLITYFSSEAYTENYEAPNPPPLKDNLLLANLHYKYIVDLIAQFMYGGNDELKDILIDIKDLIGIISSKNNIILKAIINPGPLKAQPLPSYIMSGGPEEAREILHECCRLFARIPEAHSMLMSQIGPDLSYEANYETQYQCM